MVSACQVVRRSADVALKLYAKQAYDERTHLRDLSRRQETAGVLAPVNAAVCRTAAQPPACSHSQTNLGSFDGSVSYHSESANGHGQTAVSR